MKISFLFRHLQCISNLKVATQRKTPQMQQPIIYILNNLHVNGIIRWIWSSH